MDRREVGTKPRIHGSVILPDVCERSTLPTIFLGLENKARSRPHTTRHTAVTLSRCHAVTPSRRHEPRRRSAPQQSVGVGRAGAHGKESFLGLTSPSRLAVCRRAAHREFLRAARAAHLGMSGWRIGRGNFGSHPDCVCEMNEMSKDTQLDHLGSLSLGDAH